MVGFGEHRSSSPAQLTALASLIGDLIIYNQLIANFFFLSKGGITGALPVTILDLFRDLKLIFLYFGLIFYWHRCNFAQYICTKEH